MKLPKFLAFLRSPIDLVEQSQEQKFSKDTYILVVAITLSAGAFMHGFVVTQSQLLLSYESFLCVFVQQSSISFSDNTDFVTHFVSVFYLGELLGAIISYPFSDAFGRKKTLLATSILSILVLVWYAVTTSIPNLYSAKFCLGISSGKVNSSFCHNVCANLQ